MTPTLARPDQHRVADQQLDAYIAERSDTELARSGLLTSVSVSGRAHFTRRYAFVGRIVDGAEHYVIVCSEAAEDGARSVSEEAVFHGEPHHAATWLRGLCQNDISLRTRKPRMAFATHARADGQRTVAQPAVSLIKQRVADWVATRQEQAEISERERVSALQTHEATARNCSPAALALG